MTRPYIVRFPQRLEAVAGFALHLLGSPSVTPAHGIPARGIGATKCLALLAYLAIESGPHSREELAGLLWGESPDRAARASLRQALKRLRRAAGDVLRVDRNTVELCGPVECDVTAFLAAADSRPRDAAAFDVPRFLTGLHLRHAPAFDEWAAGKRQLLLQRYEQILCTLARETMARSHWREAVVWADRWLACDPLSDEAARIVIEALYLAADRGAALARFAEHRARLEREVGSQPSAGLLRLAQRIEADTRVASAPTDSSEPGAPAPSFEASLVGRESQWRQLMAVWQAVTGGKGRFILIEGEAGVGKTRLVEEFLQWALAEGATVLRGRGYDPQTGLPYGPVVEALRGALPAPGLAGTDPEWLTEVTRLLPELRRRFPALPEPAAPVDAAGRWRLFEGVAQLVVALAAERPTVVFIDDVQWCDGETCALLHFFSRRFAPSPVALVATLALGQLERDAPAGRLCRALRTQAQATVVTLPPLKEEEVWRMIRDMGHIRAPTGARRFANRIYDVTDGNPFYVVELLKTLFAQGLLVVDAATGEWTAAPSVTADSVHQLPMPPTVRDAIAEHVGRLPYQLRDLLATVAVAGSGCRTDILSHVHGISRLHAAALCDELVDRRLLAEEDGVYRCAHPVTAEVIRDGLTESRRRELHRALALALEAVTPPGEASEVAGGVARHADRGAERALAYRYALLACEAAVRRYAFEEALSWLDLAASRAGNDDEADAVNRRTADVLQLAGWTEPPAPRKRPGTPARGIEQRDLDLRVSETAEPA